MSETALFLSCQSIIDDKIKSAKTLAIRIGIAPYRKHR